MMKKTLTITALCSAFVLTLATGLYAQAADDGFIVPLDEDLSKAVTQGAAPAAGGTAAQGPSVLQGIWIETTGSNKALIRDLATGEKKGYEYDNAHFMSNANWWFWGSLGSKFQLDAEIAVWNFDHTLFQANSYAANVPPVTWGDGIQGLFTLPFSFLFNGNDKGVGAFNKMGFTITTPWVDVKLGYGGVKANGMIDFDGIYHVIDRWDDVGKGFTEIHLGNDLRHFGRAHFNAVAGLSMMRGTYGMYDLLSFKFGEDEKNPLVEADLTFGSETTASELFRYNEVNDNALSAYVKVNPIAPLTVEAHGIASFGTNISFGASAMAGALRFGWNADKWNLSVMQSVAGKNVDSVWGSDDTTNRNDVNAGTATTQIDFDFTVNDFVSFGLDEGIVLSDIEKLGNCLWTLRNQPYADFDFNNLLGIDFTAGIYGVLSLDKPDSSAARTAVFPYFEEAGVELVFADIPVFKKLGFDYALKCNYTTSETLGNADYLNKKYSALYNSFMLMADFNETYSISAGAVVRSYAEKTAADQPVGLALGFAVNSTPLPGHPKFWVHATYGMDPYEDNNYSLYRADDPQNGASHRTYLLNSLDDTAGDSNTSSYIRFGLIWNL